MTETLYVPARYRGPARSGNGGYVAGALAHLLGVRSGHAATVTLRQPPPLEATMSVDAVDGELRLTFGGALVAQAELSDAPVEPVEAVPWDEAVAASASYPGHLVNPYPTCFVCGTERPDGLRIFPGPVPCAREGMTRVAATWVPDDSVADDQPDQPDRPDQDDPTRRAGPAVTWSALDCIGGWASDLVERPLVLGRMTAVLDDLPVLGEQHVVTGEHRGSEGRKTYTASTLHDSDGRIVGRAEHVWIAIDPASFNG